MKWAEAVVLTNFGGFLDVHPLAIILQQELVAAWGILQGNAVDGPGAKYSHSCCCLQTSQHITAPRSAAQHSTAQHSTAQHSAAQRSTHLSLLCITGYATHCMTHQHTEYSTKDSQKAVLLSCCSGGGSSGGGG